MLTDAHCHPFDLSVLFPQMEQERRRLEVFAAASAYSLEEFTHNEKLAQEATNGKAAQLLLCFGVHPQLPAVKNDDLNDSLETLHNLAAARKIAAVGECGFDLYNDVFRETEKTQDDLFAAQLEIAVNYGLPVVIHARRAMHKFFSLSKNLAKCRAVVFHSWPFPFEEGQALLRRGVNAYFSFGNVILNGHKQSVRSLSLFTADRLLTETDAPFQPRRGEKFSAWADLPLILKTAANIRGENTEALECQIEANFREVFTENHTNPANF
ncbi:MAG: TatD family hydrolase [Treponema sp.]|nr:TatD family hydrolase [Treponema sp.]